MIYNLTDTLKEVIPNNIHLKSGCYALILFQNGEPKSISRLCNNDENGILYIGKADRLLKRVTSLQQSVKFNSDKSQKEPIEKGHNSLSRKFFRIRNKIDIKNLKIKIWDNQEDLPEKLESYLLELYVESYGELPPLNGQYGKYNITELKFSSSVSLKY